MDLADPTHPSPCVFEAHLGKCLGILDFDEDLMEPALRLDLSEWLGSDQMLSFIKGNSGVLFGEVESAHSQVSPRELRSHGADKHECLAAIVSHSYGCPDCVLCAIHSSTRGYNISGPLGAAELWSRDGIPTIQ